MNRSLALLLSASALVACGGDDEPSTKPCDPTEVGTICTIAGNGTSGYAGDDGPALAARLSLPQDTLKAPDGTLYILDWNNHRVRSLPGDGTIRHVAGRGELGGSLDDPANDDFNHPTSILLDPTGTQMIVAAWHNSKIRVIDLASGTITDKAGDGRRAYFGDEGPAMTASLDLPASVVFNAAGELVVMDQANQVIRKIDAAGNIHRIAGKCVVDAPPPQATGPCDPGVEPTACPNNSGKFFCGSMAACTQPCTPSYTGDDGPAMSFRMSQPFGQSADPAGRLAYDAQGDLYFADTVNSIIRKIDTNGIVHRVAGTQGVAGYAGDGGPALSAQLNNPVDLAFGSDGTLYFTDVYNHCVRAILPDQTITTIAGVCGMSGYDGDGGPPNEATLKRPYGVEYANGTLYIADTGNQVIRSIVLP